MTPKPGDRLMKTGGRDIGVKTGRLPVKPGGLAGLHVWPRIGMIPLSGMCE